MSIAKLGTSVSKIYLPLHYCFAILLVFLLPLKFGNMVGVPEVPISLDNFLMWLIGSYPPIYFTVISVVFFMSSCLAFLLKKGVVSKAVDLDYGALYVGTFFILAFVSLIGFVKASVLDFPIIFCLHFFGLAIFAAGIFLTIKLREDVALWLLRALVWGTVVSLFISFQQLVYGFKESLEFIKASEARTGIKISAELLNRLEQTRVYAPFTLCNSLAAHLILMTPLVCVMCFYDKVVVRLAIIFSSLSLFLIFFDSKVGFYLFFLVMVFAFVTSLAVTSFFDENWQKICKVCSVFVCLFMMYILYHTFSRAAVVSFVISMLAVAMFLFRVFKLKFGHIILLLFCGLVFLGLVNQGRKIFAHSSLHVRLDYWLRGLEIFAANFFSGTGWGDFFHEYTKIKKFPGIEAPHTAHNIIVDFASQCGILGLVGISILYFFMIYPLGFEIKKGNLDLCKIKFCRLAIFVGIIAWLLHSLTDVNFQVPGTVASGILMTLAAIDDLKLKKKYFEITFANFAILGISLIVLYYAIERVRGEYYFSQLYQICEPIIIDEKTPEKYSYTSMMNALQKAVAAMPYSPYPWACAGNYAQRRGNWELTEKYYFEALKRSPERASFFFRLGLSQIKNGKFSEGLENLKIAAEIFPNNEEFKREYEKNKQKLEVQR